MKILLNLKKAQSATLSSLNGQIFSSSELQERPYINWHHLFYYTTNPSDVNISDFSMHVFCMHCRCKVIHFMAVKFDRLIVGTALPTSLRSILCLLLLFLCRCKSPLTSSVRELAIYKSHWPGVSSTTKRWFRSSRPWRRDSALDWTFLILWEFLITLMDSRLIPPPHRSIRQSMEICSTRDSAARWWWWTSGAL